MAKVKSVKFYNFTTNRPDIFIGFCVKFYDIKNNLILMDFSKPLPTQTTTYCETSEYIATADSGYDNISIPSSFHTGTFDNSVNMSIYGETWLTYDRYVHSNSWIKIEFKFPKYISNIRILHAWCASNFFSICDYDIEYIDGVIETGTYISDSALNPYVYEQVRVGNYDNNVYDALFDSIKFSKSKQIYDSNIGLIETLDVNNFRNIPINSVENLKVLYEKPVDTYLNCLISFDKKNTWKVFNGDVWNAISNTSSENIILNGMDIEKLNQLDKDKLIAGGFAGDLDFKIVMKTNDVNKTSSVTKIYIEYK